IGGKVDMRVPKVNLLEFKETAAIMGDPEDLVFGILVNISGDINGMMMFLVKVDSARALIKYLLGAQFAQREIGEEFNEIDLSALREIGNILTSAYLNALSMMINKQAIPSVPYLAKDMAAAIMSVPAIEFGKIADKVVFIESVFNTDDEVVSGYFILVPDLQSFKLILSSLGVE
ncbi:MAG: chemotaxis protein CheC, partial [Clostridiales bacterium]|nr:chemotaxis protein CheC [Clostridiales bacterium]